MSQPLPKKILLRNNQCPGDILMLTAAVRDLKTAYPDLAIAVATRFPWLWSNNPYINNPDRDYEIIPLGYKTPNQTGDHPARDHFIYAFHRSLEHIFDISIPKGAPYPDLHLSDMEKKPYLTLEKPILLINAGSKNDFPIKQWPLEHFQAVVDACKDVYTVVQIGETGSARHFPLKNAINMVDKTPERGIIRLMWQASAVLTGISFPMHLCAGLNALKPGRKCIVLAGNREDTAWEKYPNSVFLQHPCACVPANTGCWKRSLPPTLEYDPEMCTHPIRGANGKFYAQCIGAIHPDEVIGHLLQETLSTL